MSPLSNNYLGKIYALVKTLHGKAETGETATSVTCFSVSTRLLYSPEVVPDLNTSTWCPEIHTTFINHTYIDIG